MDNLTSSGPLTALVIEKKITTFTELLNHLKSLPFGRNQNREDFSLVIKEGQGTCSSKHGFAKLVADENNIAVRLFCCIYKLNGDNTPKAKKVYDHYGVEFIPEAHCVLEYNGMMYDLTFPNADYQKISDDVLMSQEITPDWMITDKVEFHQEYLKKWLAYSGYTNSFEEIWRIREEMIQSLSD